MKLKARPKRTHDPLVELSQSIQPSERQVPTAASVAEKQPVLLDASIQIQCNTLLYDTLQSMVTVAHVAGDFTYTSIADVIREAIRSHKNGMSLTELVEKGPKRTTTVRIDRELLEHYRSWPMRMRTHILERVIRTYIKTL